MRVSALVVFALLAFACREPDTAPPPAPKYRVVAGMSMGAIGASVAGTRHPDLFDAVVGLGGPLDAAYLFRTFARSNLGGFCSREQIEAVMAAHPADPDALNSPSLFTHCMGDVAPQLPYEHAQSFNHWRYTANGGRFDRSAYLDLLRDLVLAVGNPFYYNPASPFAPPGVPADFLRHPPADACAKPVVLPGFRNLEYNPDGKYSAITFCDGEEYPIYVCPVTGQAVDFCAGGGKVVPRAQEAAYAQSSCGTAPVIAGSGGPYPEVYAAEDGRFDPCREHGELFSMGVALDMNGNGRRDYAEPVLINAHERWDDVGQDGCPDPLEDGRGHCVADPAQSPFARGEADPNTDNYDASSNPFGTEGDWVYEEGEPFRDDGLDGVPGTGDYGEGNGVYDQSPNRAHAFELDPRSSLKKFSSSQRAAFRVYLDGGIRDIFNFGVQAQQLFGTVKALAGGDAFRGFEALPGPKPWTAADFDGFKVRWNKTSGNVLELYGTESPTPQELFDGDGDHVGTPTQAIQRFFLMSSYVASRWSYKEPDLVGRVSDFDSRRQSVRFYSPALGTERDFGLYLPPGYESPENAGLRYPVLYLMHGYGMTATGGGVGFDLSSLYLFESGMTDPTVNLRKMIVVFVSGRCCFTQPSTGARSCTEFLPDWKTNTGSQPGWERECRRGTFYMDRAGYTPDDATAYDASLVELVRYVDQSYRTLSGPPPQ